MRPNGWAEIKKYKADLNFSGALDAHFQPATENEAKYYLTGFESGADAMLEGLKKEPFPIGHLANAIFLNNLSYDSKLIEYEGKKGHLVFIEEGVNAR